MSQAEFSKVLAELKNEMKNFDVLHIQHELSFFKFNELQQIVDSIKGSGKKIIVTVHTAPQAQYVPAHLGGLGPRSALHFARSKGSNSRFLKKFVNPLKSVDLIIVHNKPTRENLISFGIEATQIAVVKHPVSKLSGIPESREIHEKLHVVKGDIVYATVGFISKSKGVFHAVKALKYLPANYKLAIIGGVHPDSNDTSLLDELSDYIYDNKLSDRVYITGFVEDDNRLNALIQEVDICVYPYDKQYYDYVSSGSLNLAMANGKPVIAYRTRSLLELNEEQETINFTKSGNYYELARAIKDLDIDKYIKASEAYAAKYAWDVETRNLIEKYKSLVQ
jgi:glycosyltransferase involved in cell wall biosynthesis